MARVSSGLDITQVVTVGNALKAYKKDVETLASSYGAFAAVMLNKTVTEFVPTRRDVVVRVTTIGDEVETMINADTYMRLDAAMRRYLLVAEIYTLLWERRYRARSGNFINNLMMHASHHAEAVDLYVTPTPISHGFDLQVVDRFLTESVEEAAWQPAEATSWLDGALYDLADVLNVPAGLHNEPTEKPPADWLTSPEFQDELVSTLRGMTDEQIRAARPVLVMFARLASETSQLELTEDPDRRSFWASIFTEVDNPTLPNDAGLEDVVEYV